jgi:hypothetical protein
MMNKPAPTAFSSSPPAMDGMATAGSHLQFLLTAILRLAMRVFTRRLFHLLAGVAGIATSYWRIEFHLLMA